MQLVNNKPMWVSRVAQQRLHAMCTIGEKNLITMEMEQQQEVEEKIKTSCKRMCFRYRRER